MEELQKFFREIWPEMSDSLVERVCENSVMRTFEKGQPMIAQGEKPQWMLFLMNGVVRVVSRDDNGQEVTLGLLYVYGECPMPDASFDKVSAAAIEAVTECKTACVPISFIEHLVGAEPEVQNLYVWYMRRACDYHAEIHVALGKYRSMQRYEWFVEKYAPIVDLVPDKYIASLLDMTPVTLSRIRRKMREERIRKPTRRSDSEKVNLTIQ